MKTLRLPAVATGDQISTSNLKRASIWENKQSRDLISSSPELRMNKGQRMSWVGEERERDEGRGGRERMVRIEEDAPRRRKHGMANEQNDNMAERHLEELQEYKQLKDYAVGVNRLLLQKVQTPTSGPSIHTMINAKIRSRKFKELIIGEPTSNAPNASKEFRKALDRHKFLDSPRKISRSKKTNLAFLSELSGKTSNQSQKGTNANLKLLQVPRDESNEQEGQTREKGGFAIRAVERANSDIYQSFERAQKPSHSACSKAEKRRNNAKGFSKQNAAVINVRIEDESDEQQQQHKSESRSIAHSSTSRTAHSGGSSKSEHHMHPSTRSSSARMNENSAGAASIYKTKFSLDPYSMMPSRELEPHRAHELVNRLSAIRVAHKVDINVMGKLFQDECVQKLRLAVTRYPPAILCIIERAEERLRQQRISVDLSLVKIEEMREKRDRALKNPALMERWAPSRVIYSKSLLPPSK